MKTKTLIRKQFGKTNHNRGFEIIKGKSLTIPDDTFTIRELLKKHEMGTMPPNLEREPIDSHTDDFDAPDLQKINRLDIVDKNRFKESNQNKIDEFNEEIQYQKDIKKLKISKADTTQPSENKKTTDIEEATDDAPEKEDKPTE